MKEGKKKERNKVKEMERKLINKIKSNTRKQKTRNEKR